MAEIDTSSYPRAPALPASKSVPEQIGQYQQIESQGLTISKQKLDLLNNQFKIMNAELSGLADPEGNNGQPFTKDQAAKRLSTIAQTLGFDPKVTQHMLGELAEAPDVPSFARKANIRGQSELDKVHLLYANPGMLNNGQTNQPILTSPMLNRGAPKPVGLPIQQQIPPNQPVIGPDNRETLQGPTPAIAPPGTATGPQRLPIAPTPQNFRSGLTTETPNQVVQNRSSPAYPAPSGPAVGQTPLFEEGRKALTEDQSNATARMMRAKPAIQALPLMQTPGFLSGPLTDQFTNIVAGLKSTGLVDTAASNDPTAIRQEVVKKLAQYVSGNPVGQRSDASQTLAEASSPNPKTQILPALIKLTKDAIILDRVEAARPNAFKDKDYSKYGTHRSTFPQSINEKAFGLDLENEEDSKKLVDGMAVKLNSKNIREKNEATKFFKSLQIAKDQGFYN